MKQVRLLRADEIECRIGSISENDSAPTGLTLLLYKDARCDMAILDETYGPMNWQRRHSRENANCIVSVWDEEKKQWIDKEDTGVESYTEKEKGLASDSFKRACVNWGIGRELYTAPFIFIKPDKCAIKPKYNGKGYGCYDNFKVTEIEYNERREITSLKIVNTSYKGPNDRARHTITVFNMRDGKMVWDESATQDVPQQRTAQQDPEKLIAWERHKLLEYCNAHHLALSDIWEQYGITKETPLDIFKAKFDMVRRDYGAA